jgi:hypothetical protein
MSLRGSITGLQGAIVQLYQKLHQRFSENKVISELWTAMAHDLAQQIRSIDALPPSFWNRLKDEQSGLAEAIHAMNTGEILNELSTNQPLASCFEILLRLEEPTILKVYVPIIRSLRENQENQSLDFYIMVKAHLARITRVTQAFSGNPLMIQKSNFLLQSFEKEVQAHPMNVRMETPVVVREKKKAEKAPRPVSKPPTNPLVKRPKKRPGRANPLVEKVQGRRARR